jgi:DNA polymerase-3 subunit beta
MVHFAMAQQDIRYYLNGMLLVVDGDKLMAVATDGHRLAFSPMKIEGGTFGRQEVIMPRKTISSCSACSRTSTTPSDRHRATRPSSLRRHRARVEAGRGQVPRLPARDPEGHKNTFEIGREELQRSLQRAAILTSTSSRACAASSRRAS